MSILSIYEWPVVCNDVTFISWTHTIFESASSFQKHNTFSYYAQCLRLKLLKSGMFLIS